MTTQPDSWRVSTSVAVCSMEHEDGDPVSVAELWCNYEDQDQQSFVTRSWVDEVDSLGLTGAQQWGDVYSADSPVSFCRDTNQGDDQHVEIECWVSCDPTEHCLSRHTQITVSPEPAFTPFDMHDMDERGTVEPVPAMSTHDHHW